MDYNSSRKDLVLPEYGRNIQKMVNHVKAVEDRDERNRLAKAIIEIMGNMNPHLRDVPDFTHKLWDHLAIISEFDLDVDSPYPAPDKKKLYSKPEKLPYKEGNNIRFKHYGRVLENMIKKAAKFEDSEEKDFLIEVICNQMKKSYLNWNREVVDDDIIIRDLKNLSGGLLVAPEGLTLKESRELINAKPKLGGKKGLAKGGSYKSGGKSKGGYKRKIR